MDQLYSTFECENCDAEVEVRESDHARKITADDGSVQCPECKQWYRIEVDGELLSNGTMRDHTNYFPVTLEPCAECAQLRECVTIRMYGEDQPWCTDCRKTLHPMALRTAQGYRGYRS